MKRVQFILLWVSLLPLLLMFSCSSDSENEMTVDPPQQEEQNDDDPDDDGETGMDETVQFDGFDLDLATGNFWEYYWITEDIFVAQGNASASTDNGRFRVELGESQVIAGVAAFTVNVTGANLEGYAGPRWAYLATTNNLLLGSTDGVTLDTIFNAQTGRWTGGGFFANFDAEAAINAFESEIENEFIGTSAIRASYQDGQEICEIIAGERICANEDSFTLLVDDYFKAGIGPVGYNLRRSVFDQGGGFTTSSEFTFEIGLVATSFAADDGFTPSLPPWQEKTTLPEPFVSTPVAAWNGKIYVFGGLDENLNSSRQIYTYDPETDIWAELGQTPVDLAFVEEQDGIIRGFGYQALVVNDKIYFTRVLGPEVDNILIYDPIANTWESGPNLDGFAGTPCYRAVIGDDLLFFPIESNRRGSVRILNTVTNTWSSGTTSPWPHLSRSAVSSFGDKVYFSGTFRSGEFETRVREYDSSVPAGEDGAWTDMFFTGDGRADANSQVVNGRLYVMGGDNFGPVKRTVEEYYIAQNSWKTVSAMIRPRSAFSSVALNGKIYVISGAEQDFIIEEYDPARDRRTQ